MTPRPLRQAARKGMTMIELVTAAASVALLSAALSGTAYLALKGAESAETGVDSAAAVDAVAHMLSEIRHARTITSSSPTSITFTVNDRTGDVYEETISYSRSTSLPGNPLVRTFNGTSAPVIASTKNFLLEAITEATSSPGDTQTISNYTVRSRASTTNASAVEVTSTQWLGQYCTPSLLPSTAIYWRPTRVRLSARKTSLFQTGTIVVETRVASPNGWPTGTLLGQTSIDISYTTPLIYSWMDINLTPSIWLPKNQGITFFIRRGTTTGDVQVSHVAPSDAIGAVRSTNSGASWTLYSNLETRHQITGEYTVAGTPDVIERFRWVNAKVELNDNSTTPITGSTETLNRPEAP